MAAPEEKGEGNVGGFLTEEEAKIQAEMDAEPDPENDDGPPASVETTDDAPPKPADPPVDDKTPPAAEPAAVDTEPKAAPYVPLMVAEGVQDFDEKMGQIKTAKAALDTQLEDGVLTTAEWRVKQDELSEQQYDLKRQRDEAAFAETQNMEAAKSLWNTTCENYYDANPELRKPSMKAALDASLKTLLQEKGHETRSMQWHLAEAHRRTREELGLGVVQQQQQQKPDRRPPPAPGALRNLPSAQTVDTGTDEFATINKLEGLDQEAAIARLERQNPEAYERWLAGG